jgi:hypothetical protein
MVILVPALALWANLWPGREFLNVIITVYIATFVLPLAAKITGTSVLALIPLTLIVLLVYQISRQPKREHEVASSFS